MKHLMSGNEATARGVYEAGIKVCSAYPGTPSTEILENLPQYGKDVYCEWAPNEKVAAEVAYGAAMAGSRSFCTMKMVGLNVAADPCSPPATWASTALTSLSALMTPPATPPRTSRITVSMPGPPRSPWWSPATLRSARIL